MRAHEDPGRRRSADRRSPAARIPVRASPHQYACTTASKSEASKKGVRCGSRVVAWLRRCAPQSCTRRLATCDNGLCASTAQSGARASPRDATSSPPSDHHHVITGCPVSCAQRRSSPAACSDVIARCSDVTAVCSDVTAMCSDVTAACSPQVLASRLRRSLDALRAFPTALRALPTARRARVGGALSTFLLWLECPLLLHR